MMKPILNFETFYQADSDGGIYSIGRTITMPRGGIRTYEAKQLRQKTCNAGYKMVALYKEGVKTEVLTHVLICTAFNGLPPGANFQVNHIDGCKSNNAAQNLEWVTPSQNVKHAFDVLGRKPSRQRPIQSSDPKTGKLVKTYQTIKSVEEDGFGMTNVIACARGRLKTSGRLVWGYL